MKKEIVYFILTIVGVTGVILLGWNNLFIQKDVPTEQNSQLLVTETPEMTKKQKSENPPEMTIDTKKMYSALIKTEKGDIQIELNAQETPITVNSFVYLAKKGFYENTIFHRVIKGFMIQGGDPTGTGSGGPGYTLPAEIGLKHVRGAVATARLGNEVNPKKESSGSQFFIVHEDSSFLDGEYTVFGHVTQGLDVVDAIATAPVQSGGEGSSPVNPVHILSVTITEE